MNDFIVELPLCNECNSPVVCLKHIKRRVFDALLLLITAPWFFGAVFITKISKGKIQGNTLIQ